MAGRPIAVRFRYEVGRGSIGGEVPSPLSYPECVWLLGSRLAPTKRAAGGTLALSYTLEHPERVDCLVTLGALPTLSTTAPPAPMRAFVSMGTRVIAVARAAAVT